MHSLFPIMGLPMEAWAQILWVVGIITIVVVVAYNIVFQPGEYARIRNTVSIIGCVIIAIAVLLTVILYLDQHPSSFTTQHKCCTNINKPHSPKPSRRYYCKKMVRRRKTAL